MKKFVILTLMFLGLVSTISSINSSMVVASVKFTTKLPVVEIKYPKPPNFIDPDYIDFLAEQCKINKIPFVLALKMIEWESGWNQMQATKNRDEHGKVKSIDYGLFQINSLCIDDFLWQYRDRTPNPRTYDVINNAYDNTVIALRHLRNMYNQTGTWRSAVQAYNCGLSRYRSGNVPSKTKQYVNIICPVENWWKQPRGVKIIY